MSYRIILASASPRRRELMHQAGINCEIIPAVGEEISRKGDPSEFVRDLAEHKAREVFEKLLMDNHKAACEEIISRPVKENPEAKTGLEHEGDNSCHDKLEQICCIGADTIVVHKGEILGKPSDREDAMRMIRSFQGDAHSVMTGVAILYTDGEGNFKKRVFFEETLVDVYSMTEEEIRTYVNTGECDDKAGAYGIQGGFGIFIKGIRGDYNNVVGLPIARLYHELCEAKVL